MDPSLLADDARAFKLFYLVEIVAKVLGKDLLVMLAEERRLQVERARKI